MSSIVNQAARRTPPGAGTVVTVGTTSTAAQDLSSLEGQYVVIQAKGAADTDVVHIRFGTSSVGAATTADDIFLKDGEREEFYIDSAHTHFRAVASAASCSIRYAATGK